MALTDNGRNPTLSDQLRRIVLTGSRPSKTAFPRGRPTVREESHQGSRGALDRHTGEVSKPVGPRRSADTDDTRDRHTQSLNAT